MITIKFNDKSMSSSSSMELLQWFRNESGFKVPKELDGEFQLWLNTSGDPLYSTVLMRREQIGLGQLEWFRMHGLLEIFCDNIFDYGLFSSAKTAGFDFFDEDIVELIGGKFWMPGRKKKFGEFIVIDLNDCFNHSPGRDLEISRVYGSLYKIKEGFEEKLLRKIEETEQFNPFLKRLVYASTPLEDTSPAWLYTLEDAELLKQAEVLD